MIFSFANSVRSKSHQVFVDAFNKCQDLLAKARTYLDAETQDILDNVCFAVTGSVGRSEALEASDFDLIAITTTNATYTELYDTGADEVSQRYLSLCKGLGAALGGIDVSRGRSIMGPVRLEELIDPTKIGGSKDDREALTRRIVVLTEAAQTGGKLQLRSIREQILDAYTKRTAGPHPLAFCNDLARYYRQLCMDYKAKSDALETDWAERNVKLRHSRKFSYFATALSTSHIADAVHWELPEFSAALLDMLENPPCERVFAAAASCKLAAGRMLDAYAWYLEFMRSASRRAALNAVPHNDRYNVDSSYAALQWNSKVLHSTMLTVLDKVPAGVHERMLDWFLL